MNVALASLLGVLLLVVLALIVLLVCVAWDEWK